MSSDKRMIRKEALLARRSMDYEVRIKASEIICAKLVNLPEFFQAKTVFAYVSVADEVHTYGILEAVLKAGKKLCIPYITDKSKGEMIAAELRSLDDLCEGVFAIMTAPKYEGRLQEVAPEAIDLIIVPAAAFARDGSRIGMGGGYYDRFLGRCNKALKVGLAYDCQFYEVLPVEPHDKKVNLVLVP